MPTYAYACTQCEHHFEIVQSFTDNTLTVCPACDGRLRKLFNTVGIVFKGSGFYRNDSRGPDSSASSEASTSSSTSSSESVSSTSSTPSTPESAGSAPSTSSSSSS